MPTKPLTDWTILQSRTGRITMSLFRCRDLILEQDRKDLDTRGVTWAQLSTLVALRTAGPEGVLSPTQLYDAANLSSGGLTKVLQHLEAEQLIERVDNPKDGRSKFAKLTPSGRELVETVIEGFVARQKSQYDAILTEAEQDQLLDLLSKISGGVAP